MKTRILTAFAFILAAPVLAQTVPAPTPAPPTAPTPTVHSTCSVLQRSRAARSAFMREHPCPATGRRSGACHGYVVDHINPLECGGLDAPSNMQWQTVADAKAKDCTEANCRR